ncbi:DUF1345 domain-containing protein [Microvirga flavescens]|uniref:DUF1345 domain-containing protein n=1 Tax=Microvirga flavescens TaxID=2249811 RepID=UPI000DD9B1CD|nr:DUF1345 domain-containing protein [Microvirga flavescens]
MIRFHAGPRPRLLIATALGVVLFGLLPHHWLLNTRLLVAWDAGVLVYLSALFVMFARSTMEKMRYRANLEDEGAIVVLILTLAAAVASLGAIAIELRGIHDANQSQQVLRLSIAAATILCSWFLVHTIFAVHYAHEFYGDAGERGGLRFPREKKPDYWDFLYFSFNFGAAAQTSDIIVLSRRMRRLSLGHTVLAFLFNTTVLALAVNVGAGLI